MRVSVLSLVGNVKCDQSDEPTVSLSSVTFQRVGKRGASKKQQVSRSGSNESDDSDVTICPPSTHLILSMSSSLQNVMVFGCVA